MERENEHLRAIGRYLGVKFKEDEAGPSKSDLAKKTKTLLRAIGTVKPGKRR